MSSETNSQTSSGGTDASGADAQALPKTYPYRFGEVGIMLELLTPDGVRAALKQQKALKESGESPLMGAVLVKAGAIQESQIQTILAAQRRLRDQQAQAPHADPAVANGNSETTRASKKRLGIYELIRKLGEGSMGAVFEARDVEQNQIVALKILPRHLANDPEFIERFKREVKTVEILNHPNIVAYLGSGHASGYHYLAMEFVDGESLDKLLNRAGRLEEKEAIRIVRDVASALEHAHHQNLIHRDIKPENILMAKDGTVKVTDFGLAKSQSDTSKLTAVGLSIGTPHYLSPEQAMGADNVDHRADLYSLGASLFHLLTGRVPFDHVSSTKVMVMHVQDPPPDPRTLVPSISRGASQVTLRLMSKNPDKRFSDARELIQVLDGLLAGKTAIHPAASVREAESKGRIKGVKRKLGCLGRSALFMSFIAALVFFLWDS